LDPDCWMCSSHMRPARPGTNCKKIFIAWDTVLIERLSWFLDTLFSPFSFPSYYPFWCWRFPMPCDYSIWRTDHCYR
jgi:hypothetical protein